MEEFIKTFLVEFQEKSFNKSLAGFFFKVFLTYFVENIYRNKNSTKIFLDNSRDNFWFIFLKKSYKNFSGEILKKVLRKYIKEYRNEVLPKNSRRILCLNFCWVLLRNSNRQNWKKYARIYGETLIRFFFQNLPRYF